MNARRSLKSSTEWEVLEWHLAKSTSRNKLERLQHNAPSIYGLRDLAAFLNGLPAPLSLVSIQRLLKRVRITNADASSEFTSDECNYRRKIIVENEFFLLVAITWLPGQMSPIHNHCGSACGVRVIDGTATEKKYMRVGGNCALQLGTATPYEIGSVFGGEGNEDLHALANCGDRTLKTLHLYSPPLKRESMQLFTEVPGTAKHVGGKE